MWLDDLNDLVGTLNERIEQHRDVLSKNETATRYALIDPLLTALGWDLQDPGQVQTEYNTGVGRADYAMLVGGNASRPRLVIEAKKLDRAISDGLDQSITYCVGRGIPYFVVTNGKDWAAYETHRPVPTPDKQIVDFSLTDPAQTTVMKMLWIWRGNFESGSPITPVVPDRPEPSRRAALDPQPTAPVPPSGVQRPDQGVPLDQINPGKGESPPAAVLFPDGTEKKLANWYEIQISVVEWLVGIGRLKDADCPIKGLGGRQILVSTHPTKHNGSEFDRPKQVGSVWLDTNKSTIDSLKAAKTILIARNIDPSSVQVVMGA